MSKNVEQLVKEIKDYIKKIVDDYINQHPLIRNEFVIGRESIYKYLIFSFFVKHLQKREEPISIRQLVNELRKDEDFWKDFEEELKMKDKDIVDEEERFYERTVDRYSRLNFRTKLEKRVKELYRELLELSSQEKLDLLEVLENIDNRSMSEVDMTTFPYLWNMIHEVNSQRGTGNIMKEKSINILPSQILGYKSTIKIHEFSKYKSIQKIQKKIINEGSKLSSINYKNLKELYEYYKMEIDASNKIGKALDYYQLEFTLNFSLLTEILYQINKHHLNEKEIEIAMHHMRYVLELPYISDRQKYIEIYFECRPEYTQKWLWEVKGLKDITVELVNIILHDFYLYCLVNQLSEIGFDYSVISDYYLPESYIVDYPKQQIGVQNLKRLLEINEEYNNQVIESIICQFKLLKEFLKK